MTLQWRTRAVGAAAVLLAVLAVSPAGSTPPGRDGLIAYVSHGSWVSRNYGIVLVRANGSGRRTLTRNYRDRSPAWSPDGTKLAFERAGRLYVVGSDGTGLHPITPPRPRTWQPAWSPDGRHIAFVREGSVYVMRSDGRAIRRVFQQRDERGVSRPSWSPDGKWIAFGLWDEADYDQRGSIVVMPSRGGELRYVTDGRVYLSSDPGIDANDYEPDWSPDGTRLAFTRIVWWCGPKCDQDQVYSVAVDGSDARWVTTNTRDGNPAHRPSWSPRGDRIVAESGGVAIFTATGKLLRVLDPLGTEPAWQPLK